MKPFIVIGLAAVFQVESVTNETNYPTFNPTYVVTLSPTTAHPTLAPPDPTLRPTPLPTHDNELHFDPKPSYVVNSMNYYILDEFSGKSSQGTSGKSGKSGVRGGKSGKSTDKLIGEITKVEVSSKSGKESSGKSGKVGTESSKSSSESDKVTGKSGKSSTTSMIDEYSSYYTELATTIEPTHAPTYGNTPTVGSNKTLAPTPVFRLPTCTSKQFERCCRNPSSNSPPLQRRCVVRWRCDCTI